MAETILIDNEQGIAAVKFKGKWRFFYDDDWNFLLDWRAYKYHPDEAVDPDDPRRETLVVDENNAEAWMSLLAGELTAEEIPYASYEDGGQARLIFVIDFDGKLWVGCLWHMDQSALDEYQPADWTAGEDDVFKYVPEEIARLWDGQLIVEDVQLYVDDVAHILFKAGTRTFSWGNLRLSFDTGTRKELHVKLVQGSERFAAITLDDLPPDQPFEILFRYSTGADKQLSLSVLRYPPGSYTPSKIYVDWSGFQLK